MIEYEIWVNMSYGWRDRHTDRQTDRQTQGHIDTMIWPGIGAWPCKNLGNSRKTMRKNIHEKLRKVVKLRIVQRIKKKHGKHGKAKKYSCMLWHYSHKRVKYNLF